MSIAYQRLSVRVAQMGVQTFETSVAAGITIAARAPMLCGLAQSPADAAEARRMVMEKVEAVFEANAATQLALMTFWTRLAMGAVRGPTALAHGLADVALAAARPVRSRVHANARRLVSRRAPR